MGWGGVGCEKLEPVDQSGGCVIIRIICATRDREVEGSGCGRRRRAPVTAGSPSASWAGCGGSDALHAALPTQGVVPGTPSRQGYPAGSQRLACRQWVRARRQSTSVAGRWAADRDMLLHGRITHTTATTALACPAYAYLVPKAPPYTTVVSARSSTPRALRHCSAPFPGAGAREGTTYRVRVT